MNRTLVLNSGAAWGAYHIGALDHLVSQRDLSFSTCAGTGIGAMNAAFVACDAFPALKEFWHDIGWLKLMRVNWDHPWNEAPFIGEPQAEFIARHVSEKRLADAGVTLVFNAMDLNTGREEMFEYPGGSIPLVDALRGATAVPGVTSPLSYEGSKFVEGTFINSFLLGEVVAGYPADEVYGVAALPSGRRPAEEPPERYANWREVMGRSLQLNLSRDVWAGREEARNVIASARAHRRVGDRVTEAVDEYVSDEDHRRRLRESIADRRGQSSFKHARDTVPELFEIFSSRPIEFAMWRFGERKLRPLMEVGYNDAVTAVSGRGNYRS